MPERITAVKLQSNLFPPGRYPNRVIGGSQFGGSAFATLRPRTVISSSYMGTLGYGFPTALGVKVGNPDTPVLALVGDGGLMYAIEELATSVHYGMAST